MKTKLTKRSVNYRRSRINSRQCGTCSMYRPKLAGQTGACTLVEGFIRAGDVCDRWEAK